MEEIVRIGGFDRLPTDTPLGPMPAPPRDDRLAAERDVREAMVRAGLNEVVSYSLTSRRAHVAAGGGADDPLVELVNPLSPERSVFRRSLLAGLLEAAELNLRTTDAVHLFEQGTVALPEEPGVDPRLPREEQRVGLLLSGPSEPGARFADGSRPTDFSDAADVVAGLVRHLHAPAIDLVAGEHPAFVTGACAEVPGLGHVGLVRPVVAAAFGLAGRTVYAGELDADALARLRRVEFPVKEPSRFPDVRLDLSVAVPVAVPLGRVVAVAGAVGAPQLRTVSIFDVYEGLSPSERAVGLRLTIGDDERTLTTEEASAVRERIVEALREGFGATVR
jgi:phenylalanyl-tRNA synthetase beta chain